MGNSVKVIKLDLYQNLNSYFFNQSKNKINKSYKIKYLISKQISQKLNIQKLLIYCRFTTIKYQKKVFVQMRKSSFQSTFLPAQTSLLTSIQRAKQKIFSKSIKQQHNQQQQQHIKSKNNNIKSNSFAINITNDQNSSLQSNIDNNVSYSIIDNIRQSRKINHPSIDNKARISNEKQLNQHSQSSSSIMTFNNKFMHDNNTKKQRSSSNHLNSSGNNSNVVVANAIKLLQQKIIQLQTKNKKLQEQFAESRLVLDDQESNNKQNNIQQSVHKMTQQLSTIQKQQQSDFKQYILLKQQFQSLRKQNISLYQELSKRKEISKKESGKKLNFHHQISQNISQVFQSQKPVNQFQQKHKQLELKLQKTQQQSLNYKSLLQKQQKNNTMIQKLYRQQINKNQQLQREIKQLKGQLKQFSLDANTKKNRKSSTGRQSNTNNTNQHTIQQLSINNNKNNQSVISNTILKRKNQQLQKIIEKIKSQLESQKMINRQKENQIGELERRYTQVKDTFIGLYRDLNKYHPEVINSNIRFLYQRIRKSQDIMIKSRSILSSRYGRMSQTKGGSGYNKRMLNAYRSKSGKKGLKMQDLNSSNSRSRERTNSGSRKSNKKSNNKLTYRSPYAQQNLTTRNNRLKSVQSPNQKQYRRSMPRHQQLNQANKRQIQRIMKQIKQVQKQIKLIKAQHRNLNVKLYCQNDDQNSSGNKSTVQVQKNKQRMNQLTELYNQKNTKLQQLKQQKQRLAQQTVPDL